MSSTAITQSLELASERGDPTPLIYAKVFAAHPETEALFWRDADGSVRANMLAEVVTAVLDFVEGDAYGGNILRIEAVNHENLGVPPVVFRAFFVAMRDTLREILEREWTPEFEAAWRALLLRIDGVLSEKTRP